MRAVLNINVVHSGLAEFGQPGEEIEVEPYRDGTGKEIKGVYIGRNPRLDPSLWCVYPSECLHLLAM